MNRISGFGTSASALARVLPGVSRTAPRQPRVLMFSATPRSDRGGVQAVMAAIEDELAVREFPRLRLGPDETASTTSVRFDPEVGASASGRPGLRALAPAAGSLARLAWILGRFRPTVVNVHFATGALIHFLALRPLFGFKLVLSTHGSDVLLPPPTMRPHLARFLRSADAVTVVSEAVRDRVREVAPEAAPRLIRNGVDTGFWTPAGAPRPGLIASVGRMEPVKGFDLLIEAMVHLPEAELLIAGDGPERPNLEAQTRRLGVAERVRMPGHLARDELRTALRQAAVFAMPSRSEGMPLALLEAMACGTPVVAAAVGGLPALVTPEAGLLVPPEDSEALAQGLGKILDGAAQPLRQGARQRAERFSAEDALDAYIELFRELSAGSTRRA